MRTTRKRTGSSRGSHATWSDGDSRSCHHCGKTLRITVDPALWIHTDHQTGLHASSHAGCGPPWDTQPPDPVKSPQTPPKRSAVSETPTEPVPDPDPAPDEPDDDEPDNGDE